MTVNIPVTVDVEKLFAGLPYNTGLGILSSLARVGSSILRLELPQSRH